MKQIQAGIGRGLSLVLLLVLLTSSARAATIIVGNTNLLPNTANQVVKLLITGSDLVAGVDFYAQIGDGGLYNLGTLTRPSFQGVNIVTGTIFDSRNSGQSVDAAQFTHPQIIDTGTTTNSGTVGDTGVLAVLTIDTTGVNTGTFPLVLTNVDANSGGPFNTTLNDVNGKPISLAITNGTITVPEPSAFSAIVLVVAGACLRRRGPYEVVRV